MSKRPRSYSTKSKRPFKRQAIIVAGAPSRAMVAARNMRVAAKTMAAIGMAPELKFFDTALSFNFDFTGEVPATGQLALIPQGDTQSTRDGRYAFIKSIQIRALCTYNPGAQAQANCMCHLWLVMDKQTNGAAAAFTDVFTSTAANTCMLNLNNSQRFRVLKHWVLPFNSQAGVTTAFNGLQKMIEYYKRCNIKIDWSNTDGAITGITSNNIFLLAGSDGGNDDVVSVAGTCRLRFLG